MSEPKQWMIFGRFTLDSHAVVEAETPEKAIEAFNNGDFEIDFQIGSVVDWERRGKPEDCA